VPSEQEQQQSVPPAPRGRRLSARDAVLCVALAVALLVLFEGRSVRHAGEEMRPGWERSLVLAVGHPTGWIADRLPLADAANKLTAWLGPDDDSSGPGGFDDTASARAAAGVPPVTPDAFDPAQLGAKPPPPRPLRKVLVTGDSMAMPLDAELARRLSGDAIKTERDPHVGTGISRSEIVDWGRLSVKQTKDQPEAVVMFMGANEGFPMKVGGRQVQCCGADWAAAYADRARRMMATYRRNGAARVYWLTLPAPRDADRREIARAVNAAIDVAAEPYRAQVRVLDMAQTFTPGWRYRDAMSVGGRDQIVRESDGIHLNDTGAGVAADVVLQRMRSDFRIG
jgi:lysophospholipase L1-like esterase